MSTTSPADLAVTFRSVPRRLREALGAPDAADDDVATLLAAAGRLVHAAADPAAIADAIDRVPADEWDAATLDGLRQAALDVGQRLRALVAARPPRDDED